MKRSSYTFPLPSDGAAAIVTQLCSTSYKSMTKEELNVRFNIQ
jgi:hypothetical protein